MKKLLLLLLIVGNLFADTIVVQKEREQKSKYDSAFITDRTASEKIEVYYTELKGEYLGVYKNNIYIRLPKGRLEEIDCKSVVNIFNNSWIEIDWNCDEDSYVPQTINLEDEKYLPTYGFGTMGWAFPTQQITIRLGRVEYLKHNKNGVFFELQFGMGGPSEDMLYDRSVKFAEETLGDEQTGESNSHLSILGGITRCISPTFAVFFGGGITSTTNYNIYYDPFEILGRDGKWAVEDDDDSKVMPSTTGGIIFLNNRLFPQYPPLNFGISYTTSPSRLALELGWKIW